MLKHVNHIKHIVLGGILFGWVSSVEAHVPPLYGIAERVANGLSSPLYVVSPPGDLDRLFIVEQGSGGTARIKILDLDSGTVSTFLTITGLATGGERGLLGLAFHPDYFTNGYFYIYQSVTGGSQNHRSRLTRYTVLGDPLTSNTADSASAFNMLTFSQPFSNHNGGWVGFSPMDGYLYVATGDGGSGGDPQNNANDITNNLLGKLLRIDVDSDDFPGDANRNYGIPPSNPFVGVTGDDEIWAYGLRNPWRCSFDRVTGDLYIGDVGQGVREEINFQPASSTGGENYGWRVMEGDRCFDDSESGGNPPCFDVSLTAPIYDYTHGAGNFQGFSVTGGYVYRGSALRSCLQGTYFFADFSTSNIWSLDLENPDDVDASVIRRNNDFPPNVGSINSIASFGEDGAGELYVVSLSGSIFKIVPIASVTPGDFDASGTVDEEDFSFFPDCVGGADQTPAPVRSACVENCLEAFDFSGDTDIDLVDFGVLQSLVIP